jgi:hypothetical protein
MMTMRLLSEANDQMVESINDVNGNCVSPDKVTSRELDDVVAASLATKGNSNRLFPIDRNEVMVDKDNAPKECSDSDTSKRPSFHLEDLWDMPSLASIHGDSISQMQWDNSTHNASISSHRSSSTQHHDVYPICSVPTSVSNSGFQRSRQPQNEMPARDSALMRWNINSNEPSTFETAKTRLILVESKNYLRGVTAGRALEELSPVLTLRKNRKPRNAMCADESSERAPSHHLTMLSATSKKCITTGENRYYDDDEEQGGISGAGTTEGAEEECFEALKDDSAFSAPNRVTTNEDVGPVLRVRTNFSTVSRANSFERFIPVLPTMGGTSSVKQDMVPNPPRRRASFSDMDMGDQSQLEPF